MRVLVTNDDGINSLGLKILAQKALKLGEVIVVAPKVQQSGKSHAINIQEGLFFEKLNDLIPGVDTYLIDSTPADCVRFAKYFLNDPYDLVLSGINNGYNLGEDIMYSGTVACATEAVFTGKKAIAFSTTPYDFSEAELRVEETLEFIFHNKLLEYANLYNVNIPLNSKGIKITHQGRTHYDTRFVLENNLVYQRGTPNFDKDNEYINSD
ncbi:MAG TPA: 5'/3'-nucleotidase SurE, partial [Bacilli bacterium]